jgi:hypothetical protein
VAQVSGVDIIAIIPNLLAAFSPIVGYQLQHPEAA